MAAFTRRWLTGLIRKHGLDVTLMPGRAERKQSPAADRRPDRILHEREYAQAFDAVAQNIPTLVVASIFQKDPQVLLAHPDQGMEKFEDLKKLTLLISNEGVASYFQWMKHDFGFRDQQVKPYTFNPHRSSPTSAPRCRAM